MSNSRALEFYKPTKKKTGSACRFIISIKNISEDPKYVLKDGVIFVEMAKQTGDIGSKSVFDWKNKIVIAFGINDICLIRDYLKTKSQKVEIVHKNKDVMSTIKIEDGRNSGYFFCVSKNKTNIGIPLSVGEMSIINDLLTIYINKIYG